MPYVGMGDAYVSGKLLLHKLFVFRYDLFSYSFSAAFNRVNLAYEISKNRYIEVHT